MERQLSYMVVDDDPKAIDLLVTYGQRMPQLRLATTETHGLRALQYLNQHPVDLLLLDVDMPGMTGIEVAQALYPATMIILVTGHDRFAVQGFEIQAIDFLLKPPSFKRFTQAIHRAFHSAGLIGPLETKPSPTDYTYVTIRGEETCYQRVDFDQICYIESLRNEVRLKMANNKTINVRSELFAFLSKLPPDTFVQVHRGYVINLAWLEIVSKSFTWLTCNDKKISIGRKYRDDFVELWKERWP